MSFFIQPTNPPEAKSKDVKKIAIAYAMVLATMLICQLFTYSDFCSMILDYRLPGGELTARLFGAFILGAEFFAIPFLLRLRLSPLMRLVSMASGWLVAFLWVFLAVWHNFAPNEADYIVFLGAVVKPIIGLWEIPVAATLGVMSAWSSWGMWPLSNHILRQKDK